jgi:hypothetical protein
MGEQRMKILEMLEAGKITVEEARALLQSVSGGRRAAVERQREQVFKPYRGVEAEDQESERPVIHLMGGDLSGANLHGTNLKGCRLEGAILAGANLGGANLLDADFRGANLSGANLRNANFEGADLREADLSGANLPNSDFGGVRHPGLNLSGASLPGYRFCGDKAEDTEDVSTGSLAPDDGTRVESLSIEGDSAMIAVKAPKSPTRPQPPSETG